MTMMELGIGPDWMILDDASHFWGHQIEALSLLFSSLIPGGYILLRTFTHHLGSVGKIIPATTLLMRIVSFCFFHRWLRGSAGRILTWR